MKFSNCVTCGVQFFARKDKKFCSMKCTSRFHKIKNGIRAKGVSIKEVKHFCIANKIDPQELIELYKKTNNIK